MRIWHIPPSYLDNKRLAALHNECHGLLKAILLDRGSWKAAADPLRRSCQYIVEVHRRAVNEMYARTIERGRAPQPHPSPMPLDSIPLIKRSTHFEPGTDQLRKDVTDLRRKWEAEGYHHGTGRTDLRHLEKDLGLEPGRSPFDIQALRTQTKWTVKEHKTELDRMKGTLGQKLAELRRRHATVHTGQVHSTQDGEPAPEGQVGTPQTALERYAAVATNLR